MRTTLVAVSSSIALLAVGWLVMQRSTAPRAVAPVAVAASGAAPAGVSAAAVAGPGDPGEPAAVPQSIAAGSAATTAQRQRQFAAALSNAMHQPAAPNEGDGR